MLDNIQINESNNYLWEETKEECQEDTHKKAEETQKSLQRDSQSKEDRQNKYSRVETLHSLDYSVNEIAQDSQVNISLSTVKRLKSKIKSTWKYYERRRIRKTWIITKDSLKNYILQLIVDSPINSSNRIALKLKNNYEVEVHRNTFLGS